MGNVLPITFGALVLEGKKKINIRNVIYKGPLKKNQVLVKIHYSGICGKQVEEYNFKMGKDRFIPHLLGHEGSGEVVQISSGVKHVKPGDKVVMHWMKNSFINESSTPNFLNKENNKKINAGWITTFSEYSVVSSDRLTKINKNANLKIACLMGCCITTGVGTVYNQSNIKTQEKALVVGAGGVGLSVIIGLKMKKIKFICAYDKNIKNLQKAKELGANLCLKSKQKSNSKLKGFSKIFIATGSKSAILEAIKLADAKADLYFIGVPRPNTKIQIDALHIHHGVNLHSSCGGEMLPAKLIPKCMKLYRLNPRPFKRLIINEIKLNEALGYIKKMAAGKANHGRNLIKFI